ncbi:ThuA domain-containing protein [Agromyces sp. MMS24-K17]|uniref:ThuA domain-containing protein n=1 Tax=Agromyces sp. MMS24-K17 TaxID=3372850 RepID=UPI003754EB40
MPRAMILSGAGRYADPWHPFPATSERLAELVREAGYDVEVREDIDAALAALGDDVDLLVVNAGNPDGPVDDGEVAEYADAIDGDGPPVIDSAPLQAAIDRGIGILALHAAASSLPDYPAYHHAIGGRWVPGESWHPEFGEAHVHLVGDHPVRAGLLDFDVQDERYTALRLHDVIEPIAEHLEDGIRHPLIWGREFGPSRLVYDGLGHDTRSYDSTTHRELITQAIGWLDRRPERRLGRGAGAAGPEAAGPGAARREAAGPDAS